jgi:hypothetical protein
MSDGHRPPPVPGVPPAALADGRTVAKAWLLALLEQAPLEAAAGVPAGRLAQEGPALCEAVLDAVGADAALDGLGPDGERHAFAAQAGVLAGARGPTDAVAAVGLLRVVAWRELRAALGPLDADATAALAERLAHVAERVAAAAAEPGAAAAPRLVAVPDADDRPWVRAAARIAARPGEAPAAFALLALELGAGAPELAAAEARVRAALPSAHMLIRERPGRLWILAPGASGAQAVALGERLAAVAGEPAVVRVGVASCPEDGREPGVLAARAEAALGAPPDATGAEDGRACP